MSVDAQKAQGKNPYKKGKQRLIAEFILKGMTNYEIESLIDANKLDQRFQTPVNKRDLWNTRSDLKKMGLLDADGFPLKSEAKEFMDTLPIYPIQGVPDEMGKIVSEEPEAERAPAPVSVSRRPDWDVLTSEMIDRIPDPKLRMEIMNYRADVSKEEQRKVQEGVTRGELTVFKDEITARVNEVIDNKFSARFGGIEDKINALLGKFEEAGDAEGEAAEVEGDEGGEPIIMPGQPDPYGDTPQGAVVRSVNQLSEEASEPKEDDDIIIVKGITVTRKPVGFFSKSLVWFDYDVAHGFRGNLADYVNACIADVHKGRGIKLMVTKESEVT